MKSVAQDVMLAARTLLVFSVCSCESSSSSGGLPSQVPPDASGDVDAAPTACAPAQPGSPHLAIVPVPYARRRNPVIESSETLADGRALYARECARCHGDTGKGDGAPRLMPAPADFTLREHLDDYLFWRVSEGGQGDPTCSAMPAFRAVLSEESRWRLVRYVQLFSELRDTQP